MNKVIPEELLAKSFPLHTTLVNQLGVRRFFKKTKKQNTGLLRAQTSAFLTFSKVINRHRFFSF